MWKRIKELLGDSAVYGLGSVLEKLGGFVLLLFFANLLSPGDYGVLGLLMYMEMAFEAVSSFGMRSAVFREFALADTPEAKRRIVNTGIFSVFLGACVIAGIGMLFARPIAILITENAEYTNLVRVDFLGCVMSAVAAVPMLVFQAARRSRVFAGVNFIKFMTTSCLSIVMIGYLHWGVWGQVVAVAVSNALFTIVLCAVQLREYGFEIHLPTWKKMLTYGIPFVPYRLLLVVNAAFSTYMVAKMLSVSEAGIYSVASRFAMPLGFIVEAINNAWWPYKFRIYKEEKNPAALFRTITTFHLALTTYLWVGISLWGPELLRWFIRSDYHDAAYVIAAIALTRLMMGVYQMFSTGIELGDDAKPIALVSLAGLLVGLGTSFAFIPLWESVGAAIAASLGSFVMTVVVFQLGQARMRIAHDWPAIVAIAIASVACVLLGHAVLRDPSVWHRLVAECVLSLGYPLLIALLLSASRTQRERMRALYQRIRAIRSNA